MLAASMNAMRPCAIAHWAPLPRIAPPLAHPDRPRRCATVAEARRRGSGDEDREQPAWRKKASRKGKSYENQRRRRGRPEFMRSPDDTPLRDGNRDRVIGLLTLRAAKTLTYYLYETNPNVYHWLVVFIKDNPIPQDGAWDDVSGDTFLRKLLSMPIEHTSSNLARNEIYTMNKGCGVDPRNIAQRIMEIRTVIAKEMTQDLTDIGEENSVLMRETLQASLQLSLQAVAAHPLEDGPASPASPASPGSPQPGAGGLDSPASPASQQPAADGSQPGDGSQAGDGTAAAAARAAEAPAPQPPAARPGAEQQQREGGAQAAEQGEEAQPAAPEVAAEAPAEPGQAQAAAAQPAADAAAEQRASLAEAGAQQPAAAEPSPAGQPAAGGAGAAGGGAAKPPRKAPWKAPKKAKGLGSAEAGAGPEQAEGPDAPGKA